MMDWNRDGKIDDVDKAIDFMMFSKSNQKDDNEYANLRPTRGYGDGATVLGCGLLIFGVFLIIAIIVVG